MIESTTPLHEQKALPGQPKGTDPRWAKVNPYRHELQEGAVTWIRIRHYAPRTHASWKVLAYYQRLGRGKCAACGVNNWRPGRTTCKPCSERKSAKQQKRDEPLVAFCKAARICVACKKRDAESGQRCLRCARKRTKETRARRAGYQDAGKCTRCSKVIDRKVRPEPYRTCEVCGGTRKQRGIGEDLPQKPARSIQGLIRLHRNLDEAKLPAPPPKHARTA